jgi:hypothetical protein
MTDQRGQGGFRQLGDLLPKIEDMRPSADTTRDGSIPSSRDLSTTTGTKSRSSISLRLGATGSVPRRILPLAEAMATGDPEAIDRSLVASLPRSVVSRMTPVWSHSSSDVYGWDGQIIDYQPSEDTTESPPHDDVAKAAALISRVTGPCPIRTIKEELARLRATTKSRGESSEDMAVAASVYAEYLEPYPKDIVVDALRAWARTEKWWPAWSELKESLDRRMRRRKGLMGCVRGML